MGPVGLLLRFRIFSESKRFNAFWDMMWCVSVFVRAFLGSSDCAAHVLLHASACLNSCSWYYQDANQRLVGLIGILHVETRAPLTWLVLPRLLSKLFLTSSIDFFPFSANWQDWFLAPSTANKAANDRFFESGQPGCSRHQKNIYK